VLELAFRHGRGLRQARDGVPSPSFGSCLGLFVGVWPRPVGFSPMGVLVCFYCLCLATGDGEELGTETTRKPPPGRPPWPLRIPHSLWLSRIRVRVVLARHVSLTAENLIWALFTSSKILQKFSNSSSHRIFRRMYGVLNIDKNKN
jgi:hypothetical protein